MGDYDRISVHLCRYDGYSTRNLSEDLPVNNKTKPQI